MTHYQALVKLEEISISHWIERLREVDWDWQSSIGRWVNLCDSVRRLTQRVREMEKLDGWEIEQ